MVGIGLMGLGTSVSFSQNYPNTPIRIVTVAAGGGADLLARLIGQGITSPLDRHVVADNRGEMSSSRLELSPKHHRMAPHCFYMAATFGCRDSCKITSHSIRLRISPQLPWRQTRPMFSS
jgi:hypothetical protein